MLYDVFLCPSLSDPSCRSSKFLLGSLGSFRNSFCSYLIVSGRFVESFNSRCFEVLWDC